jgi:hypothetical protein
MNFDPSSSTDEQQTLFAIVCLQSNEECIFHHRMSKKAINMKAPQLSANKIVVDNSG